MSISQNFPEEGPTLNLNFASSRTLDPRITFSRSQTTSNGSSYMDENGLIRYAGPDEPRFDHRYVNGEVESLGLLIEEQRINQQKRSENFTIASGIWNEVGDGVSVTSNQVIAPDGNMTADKVAVKTSGGGSKGIQGSIITSQENRQYTVSVFAKADDHSNIKVEFQGGGKTVGIYVDLLIGNTIGVQGVPDDYDVIPYPNGWYRIYVTNTAAATAGAALRIYLTSGTTHQFTGTPENGVYLWGAQLEHSYIYGTSTFSNGFSVSSYIPTLDSAVTRNPDNVSMTGTNLTDWFNPNEGTVYAHTIVNGVKIPSFNRLWSFTNSNLNVDGLGYYISASSNTDGRYGISATINSVSQFSIDNIFSSPANVFNTPEMKSCFAFQVGNSNVSYNGVIPVSGGIEIADFPDIDRFLIGQPQKFQGYSCMTVSQLTYYPTRLPNSQLQNLTK